MEGVTYKQLDKNKNKYKFEVTVKNELFEDRQEKVFANLSKNVKIAGFRPGKAPREALEKELGPKVYIETINRILPEAALDVVEHENLNPISSFNYDLKDVDGEKDISFTFEFVNQPEIDSAAFSKIKVEFPKSEVKADEIDSVIKSIVKSTLPRDQWEKYIVKKEGDVKHDAEHKEHHHDHDGHDHSHTHEHDEDDIELRDELVSLIGYQDEKTLDGMKAKVKETLVKIKEEQSENEFASKVIVEAIKLADFEVPEDFVKKEVENKTEQFKKRLIDLKLDESLYLTTQNTTLEKLQATWAEQAKLDLSTDLLLVNYAVKEELVPSEDEVTAEIEKIEDPKVKAQYKKAEYRDYVKTTLSRNKGLKKLVGLVRGEKAE